MTLDELIPRYAENKKQESILKKELEDDNNAIKELMSNLGQDEYEAGGYTAKYSVSERESLDEVKLLDILKKAGIQKEGLIKTIEQIDMEVLEDMLYKDEIPQEVVADMDSCRNVKEVITLRISKTKKKKEEE